MYTKKLIPEKSVLSNRLYVRFFVMCRLMKMRR